MVHLKGQYDVSDFVKAQRLHNNLAPWLDWLSYLALAGAALALLAVMVALALGHTDSLQALPGALLVGGAAFIHAVWLPRRYARDFRRRPDLAAPFEIEISEAGLTFRNEAGTNIMRWSFFTRWKESADLLLLYRVDTATHILPKRLFHSPGEIDYVRQKLRENRVPMAGDSRRAVQLVIFFLLLAVALAIILYGYR
jgi:YcxB-like protein